MVHSAQVSPHKISLLYHHHIVSAVTRSRLTDRSYILAMTSLLGLSPICSQLIQMWSMFRWWPVTSAPGWLSAMFTRAVWSLASLSFRRMFHFFRLLLDASHCSCHYATLSSAGLHSRACDNRMNLLREYRWPFTGLVVVVVVVVV